MTLTVLNRTAISGGVIPMRNCAVLVGCRLIIGSFQLSTSEISHALRATPGLTQSSLRWPITVDNVRQLKQVGRITRAAVASRAGLWLYQSSQQVPNLICLAVTRRISPPSPLRSMGSAWSPPATRGYNSGIFRMNNGLVKPGAMAVTTWSSIPMASTSP